MWVILGAMDFQLLFLPGGSGIPRWVSYGTLVVSKRCYLGSMMKIHGQNGTGLPKLEQKLENLVWFSRV